MRAAKETGENLAKPAFLCVFQLLLLQLQAEQLDAPEFGYHRIQAPFKHVEIGIVHTGPGCIVHSANQRRNYDSCDDKSRQSPHLTHTKALCE